MRLRDEDEGWSWAWRNAPYGAGTWVGCRQCCRCCCGPRPPRLSLRKQLLGGKHYWLASPIIMRRLQMRAHALRWDVVGVRAAHASTCTQFDAFCSYAGSSYREEGSRASFSTVHSLLRASHCCKLNIFLVSVVNIFREIDLLLSYVCICVHVRVHVCGRERALARTACRLSVLLLLPRLFHLFTVLTLFSGKLNSQLTSLHLWQISESTVENAERMSPSLDFHSQNTKGLVRFPVFLSTLPHMFVLVSTQRLRILVIAHCKHI